MKIPYRRIGALSLALFCIGTMLVASASPLLAQSIPTLRPNITRSITVVAGFDGVQFVPDEADGTSRILPAGTVLRVIGRSEDSTWLYIKGDAGEGWIAAEGVIAFGLEAVAVLELPNDKNLATAGNEPVVQSPTGQPVEPQSANSTTITDSLRITSTMSATAPSAREEIRTAQATISTAISRLNVRTGPGVQYGIVTQVAGGSEVDVLGQNSAGNWLEIQMPLAAGTPTSGWISKTFVALNSTETLPTSTAVSQVSTAAANSPTSGPTAGAAGLQGTLVFQQSLGGTIYVYNLSSGSLRPLTQGQEPDLSPDGRTVVFARGGGSNGIYLINIDGSDERVIFSGRENLASPKWSPDGSEILFTRGDEWLGCTKRGSREICSEVRTVGESEYRKNIDAISLIDRNGGNFRDLVSQRPSKAPDWTNGVIVYQSPIGLQVTTSATDATNALIDYDYLLPVTYDPDLQPGGGTIIFQTNEGSHWQLYAIESDGTGRRGMTKPKTTLVDQLPSSVSPAWSPDGRFIVYVSNMTPSGEAGDWKLWVMNADGTNQRPLPINLSLEYTFGVEQVVSWR